MHMQHRLISLSSDMQEMWNKNWETVIRPISLETLPLNYSPILRKSESLVQHLFSNLLYQSENSITNEENI